MNRIGTIFRSAIAVAFAMVIASCATHSPDQRAGQTSEPLEYLPSLAGTYFAQVSRETGRRYHIYVRLPDSYAKASPGTRYPVVYVLDGDSLFPMLAPEHLFLVIDEKLPEAITVGIAYGSFEPSINKRDVDFAPDGAAAFQRFLKSELIPEIERRFRADPDRRILFGQSLGGSFVLYSACTEPDLFWGRITSNASLARYGEGKAPSAGKSDLRLVVTSGTRVGSQARAAALRWFSQWQETTTPWRVKAVNIEGGTHASDSTNAYRAGMLWMFGEE